jgi:hypothetical protein
LGLCTYCFKIFNLLAGLFVDGPAAVAVGAIAMARNISALVQKLNDYDEVFK